MNAKTNLFNLALNALLIQTQIQNADSDQSTQAKVLRNNFQLALNKTLEDLDLDSTSTIKQLELIEEKPNSMWLYVYKYPTDCVFLRRIVSGMVRDNSETRIKLRVAQYEGERVIFTNEPDAVIEYISKNINVEALPTNVMLAIGQMLAWIATPLQVNSKNTVQLRKQLKENYDSFKKEAQRIDAYENFEYEDEYQQSSFVRARMS